MVGKNKILVAEVSKLYQKNPWTAPPKLGDLELDYLTNYSHRRTRSRRRNDLHAAAQVTAQGAVEAVQATQEARQEPLLLNLSMERTISATTLVMEGASEPSAELANQEMRDPATAPAAACSSGSDMEIIDFFAPQPPWKCVKCTFRNQAERHQCKVCQWSWQAVAKE